MNDHDPFGRTQRPTAQRPLLGMTVLAVEDSRYASEALRLMCLRSGARIRRADCLRAARRHLQVYRPSVVIVDLGLPDGSGLDLIAELDRARPRVGALIATSGEADSRDRAIAAGGDTFLDKPLGALGAFQHAVLATLPSDRRPAQPAPVSDETVEPDRLAYSDDMHQVKTLLEDQADTTGFEYAAQFLASVAAAAEDTPLQDAAQALRQPGSAGPVPRDIARLRALIRDRINDRIAI